MTDQPLTISSSGPAPSPRRRRVLRVLRAGDPPRTSRQVGISGKERGIVAAASYEAKAKGVVRGVRLSEVMKLCLNAVSTTRVEPSQLSEILQL